MADNANRTPGSGEKVATDEVAYSGDTAMLQIMRLAHVAGSEGSKTVVEIVDANGIFSQGNVAHDAADAGNPLSLGAHARTTFPTAVADADRVRIMADKHGRLVVREGVPRSLIVAAPVVTLSNTTETSLIAAGGSGVFLDLKMLIITNTAGQPLRLDVRDSTGGTVLFSLNIAPSGGGAIVPFPIVWPQTTANNPWTIQLGTSASSLFVAGLFIKET